MPNRSNIADDGFAPWLLEGATLDHGYPCIDPLPSTVPMPHNLVPFSKRNTVTNRRAFIHFYEDDTRFRALAANPDRYLPKLQEFEGVIAPDFSLYWGAPEPVLQGNVYRSRVIGHYLQRSGLPVVPNIRWGDERTFDFCFRGVAQHCMVAVSTIGCIASRKEKQLFARGLEAMMSTLEPSRVIVNGPMPAEVFGRYWDDAEFRTYPAWTRRMKECSYGHR
ncbi:hypothetical protein D2E25_0376 [Bifidobacterium goeldii]|uniref:DUF4417 domain-containing protein n=1 Tax=Bifidobacterium goeldii TaxID=2306975 RepID=A0A430FMM9_9BIFI|nr:DUF4417 domain-containing protein [Bifidobacterium goeldii]RSX54070.1 hypothetical protein D2E25_0376 [Bifidobacterium goeldii]